MKDLFQEREGEQLWNAAKRSRKKMSAEIGPWIVKEAVGEGSRGDEYGQNKIPGGRKGDTGKRKWRS